MLNPLRKRNVLDLSPGAKVVAYASLLVWAFVVLFPLYWLLVTSFKVPIQFSSGTYYLPFIDFQPTLDNWKYILVDLGNDTYRPYFNTIVVGITSALLALALGSIAAYGLVRFRYRPRLGVIGLGIGCIVFAVRDGGARGPGVRRRPVGPRDPAAPGSGRGPTLRRPAAGQR